jgi:hypothetical protein
MLIQHEETGRISEIADDAAIPSRWHSIPEAARVETTVALSRGRRVRVKSAVLGAFESEINERFTKDGALCYTLRNRQWVYAGEVTPL